MELTNWSGSVRFIPSHIHRPKTQQELVEIILNAVRSNRSLRALGSRHSFSELIATSGISLSLDRYKGIVSVDTEKKEALIRSGTKLNRVSESLLHHGLMMENLGDIDVQSLAGSISTGTHGTGINFGILATQVKELALITANGESLVCSEEQNRDLFKAALVSLGTLGVIFEMKLSLVPSYRLKFVQKIESLKDCLSNLDQRLKENRNFEFFLFPYTDVVQTKALNVTDETADHFSISHHLNDLILENGVLKVLCEICRIFPHTAKAINKICGWGLSGFSKVNYAHKVFTTPRYVKFHEMEYNIPRDRFKDALLEVVEAIEKKNFAVCFPLECRFAKADDIWLSPAYKRDSAYIAAHMYKGMEYQKYFSTLESIFKNHQGRPHWGKMHTQTAEDLSKIYPMWDQFQELRLRLDPKGTFMSPYMRTLLGVDSTKHKAIVSKAA
ncbi:MAG: D-arabinono-1,4-lactone oxidase [Bdellovibrionia bacterium]